MELRHYLGILWRSWPLVVGLPALVALLTLALAFGLPQRYVSSATMVVTQRPIRTEASQIMGPNEEIYYSWLSSEYIVDDALQIVETSRFARDIAAWIQAQHGRSLAPEAIGGAIEAERQHRTIYLTAVAGRADDARWIAQGAVAMLQQNGLKYWDREESTSLEVSVLDLPDGAAPARGLFGLVFDLVLRSLLALILAIGLAFLRHYLDESLHQRGDIEALGLEVVGMIPKDGLRRPQP